MNDSIDSEFGALQAIGLTEDLRRRWLERPPQAGQALQRLTEVQKDRVRVHDGHVERTARVRHALTDALSWDDDALAVGDWLCVQADAAGEPWVVDRLPPRNQLARRSSDGNGGLKRQVLVANVDLALLVMGLDHDFNLRRLERYLTLAHGAGIASVLVLTKADVAGPLAAERRLEQARAQLPPQVQALALDGRDADAAAGLRPWLGRGETAVLLGSSGAGKSTLTNTLCGLQGGPAARDTGPVREDDGRGRHTTTVRTLHRTLHGGCIVDTPGLRALRLDVADEAALDDVFGDVARQALQCRFRNCTHRSEPGCAVREGVPQARLASFHKLQREVRRDSMSVLERREQLARWKAMGRAGSARARAKRGE